MQILSASCASARPLKNSVSRLLACPFPRSVKLLFVAVLQFILPISDTYSHSSSDLILSFSSSDSHSLILTITTDIRYYRDLFGFIRHVRVPSFHIKCPRIKASFTMGFRHVSIQAKAFLLSSHLFTSFQYCLHSINMLITYPKHTCDVVRGGFF